MNDPDKISITQPDDWHLHVRDNAILADVLPHTAQRFARAIIMPNLKPPVATVAAARLYRQRIMDALPTGSAFEPLMTLYLTPHTAAEEIHRAKESGIVHGIKLYPAGATTHSDAGVHDLQSVRPVLEAMAEVGLPLLVHGEVTDPGVDVFDRERVFIERQLLPQVESLPTLRVVLEHITTKEAVAFVTQAHAGVAATVTPQHLLMNRNELFRGGIRPHHYCLPVLKREIHRETLLAAVSTGNPKFFLGTDSAPHSRSSKESHCGCAGIYSAHAAIELYAEAFDEAGALDKLEGFASFHGADFYGLPRNRGRITLVRQEWQVPEDYPLGGETVVPLRAGERVRWQLVPAQ